MVPVVFTAFLFGFIIFWFLRPRKTTFDVNGKVVVITGAASGIGKGLAISLMQRGGTVVCIDLNQANLGTLTKEHPELHHTYVCDVSNPAIVAKVMQDITKQLGEIDVLINNAGIVQGKFLTELSCEDIQRTMNVNTMAHFWTTKAVLPRMMERNSGMIVTVASVMGINGAAKLVDYCTSKFACVGFHESLRLELQHLGKRGIHTLLVCPLGVTTGMFDGAFESGAWWEHFIHKFLIPMLPVDEVVKSIVDGIEHKDEQLITCAQSWHKYALPTVSRASRFLPTYIMDFLLAIGGGHNGMDNFRGHD
ncbi:short-chain dehydrogenase/reductase family 16C member 6-like isoform X1 [Thraustotheca clavata]|uniref:Short-chain dehydrogenase/reductase 3 n=1 Tax=Thraustotheca clavata TaxID=74557 RepID=A0A1V9YRY7_9STRA|nr:short-chain dehydrogenase/reductase family 16C member 6-like isoform X1 [Thraustotheca clavata]